MKGGLRIVIQKNRIDNVKTIKKEVDSQLLSTTNSSSIYII